MKSILFCEGVKVMSDFILIILPLILVGISMVLLVNNIKKKILKDATQKQKEDKKEDYMPLEVLLGVSVGAVIGLMFTNKFGSNSISYGICFGVLGAKLIAMTIKKK